MIHAGFPQDDPGMKAKLCVCTGCSILGLKSSRFPKRSDLSGNPRFIGFQLGVVAEKGHLDVFRKDQLGTRRFLEHVIRSRRPRGSERDESK